MHGIYTRRKINALRERGRKMANARWTRHRQEVEAAAPAILRDIAETSPEESFDPDHDSHDETTYNETP